MVSVSGIKIMKMVELLGYDFLFAVFLLRYLHKLCSYLKLFVPFHSHWWGVRVTLEQRHYVAFHPFSVSFWESCTPGLAFDRQRTQNTVRLRLQHLCALRNYSQVRVCLHLFVANDEVEDDDDDDDDGPDLIFSRFHSEYQMWEFFWYNHLSVNVSGECRMGLWEDGVLSITVRA